MAAVDVTNVPGNHNGCCRCVSKLATLIIGNALDVMPEDVVKQVIMIALRASRRLTRVPVYLESSWGYLCILSIFVLCVCERERERVPVRLSVFPLVSVSCVCLAMARSEEADAIIQCQTFKVVGALMTKRDKPFVWMSAAEVKLLTERCKYEKYPKGTVLITQAARVSDQALKWYTASTTNQYDNAVLLLYFSTDIG
eukprot:2496017-Rhodomonas_salina.2